RIHFEVAYEGPKAILRDLNSRNGIFVNGRRVDGQRTLGVGVRILAGEQSCDVYYVYSLVELAVGVCEKITVLAMQNGYYHRKLAGEQAWDVTNVERLDELAGEAEETIELLDKPNGCIHCQRPISLATFAEGAVLERDNQYLCPDCSVVVGFDSREFHGFEV